MAERTVQMRKMLVSDLQGAGSQIDWSHLTKQIGMFAYTVIFFIIVYFFMLN